MSTFERMLARERDALPQNTGSYYELEQGDLKYDGIKNINDAIDADIKDFQQRTNWAIEESKRYHEVKKKKLESLVGLIGTAANFKKWEDARKEADAVFERYYVKNFDDYGQPKTTEEQEEYDNKVKVAEANRDLANRNVLEKTQQGIGNGILDTSEAISLTSESQASRENISGIEAGNQYVEGWQPFFAIEVNEKKQLVNPRTGDSMPYAMSYMEVLESDNREIQQFLPWLYRDIYYDYHAAMKKAGLVDTMGTNHFRYKVFPKIANTGSQLQQKLLDRQLSVSIKNAEDRINQDILTKFNSYKSTKEQVNYIFGPGGFLASRETDSDGNKNNPKAWEELTEWMDWAVDKGEMRHEVAQAIIDSDEIPLRGNKIGTIEDMKNPRATAFKTKITWAIGSAKLKDDRAEKAINNDTVKDLVIDKITSMEEDLPEGEVLTNEQINNGRNEVIEAAKDKGIYLSKLDPLLARFNTLESNLTRNESNARSTLDAQIENNEQLSGDLFKHIPRTGDPTRNRSDYEEFGRERGVLGQTREDQAIRERNLEYELTRGDAAILDPKRKDSYEGIDNKARSLYNDWFDTYLADATKDKKLTPTEFKKVKENAKRHALNEVRKEALLKKNEDKGLFAGGLAKLPDEETSELQSTAAVIKKIKTEGVNALAYNLYYPGEKEPLLAYIEWKKNPKGMAPLSYWRSFSPHIRKEVPGMPNAASIVEDRVAATELLREKGEENVSLPLQESANDEDIIQGNQKEDDAKYCQAVVKPETLDIMLKDLAVEDRDFDTVYSAGIRTTKGWQEEKFDNELHTGKPLSQNLVGEVLVSAKRAKEDKIDLRFGIYDIPADIVYDMYDKGIISPDEVFDEELQKEIVLRKIINIANERGSNKTWDNTYRRNNWITRQEKAEFTRIMTAMTGQEITDPYSDITLLSPECAKALIGSAMGQQ